MMYWRFGVSKKLEPFLRFLKLTQGEALFLVGLILSAGYHIYMTTAYRDQEAYKAYAWFGIFSVCGILLIYMKTRDQHATL